LTEQVQFVWNQHWGFRKNSLVRKEGDTFILPIRTRDYDTIKTELKEVIESYWTFKNQKLVIEWTEDPRAFQIIKPDYYVNAATYISERKVYISSSATIEAFPHEIGHVLGLPDDYFVMWHSKSCEYVTHLESGNIMSLAEG